MKEYKLDDLFDIQIGKTPSRSNPQYWGTGNTWLSIRDLNNLSKSKWIIESKEQITNSAISDCNLKIIPANTLLYSFKLSIGKVAINKHPIYTNEAIAALIPKNNIDFDLDYIFYLLKFNDYSNLSNEAVKGKSLNKEKLKTITISLPALEEQKKISGILNKNQFIINSRKKTIKLLNEFIGSYFEEMFGDPFNNTKGFGMSAFKDIEFKSGFSFKSSHYIDSGIPLLKIGEANSKSVDENKLSFLPPPYLEKYADYVVKNGDFILSLTGTYNKSDYGNLNIIKSDKFDQYLLNQRVAQIIYNEEKYSYYFIYYLFNHYNLKKHIQSSAKGVRQVNISTKKLASESFILPPKNLQDRFNETCTIIASLLEKLQNSLELLLELNNALMYRSYTWKKDSDFEEETLDVIINDDFEMEKLLSNFLVKESFENITHYEISNELLFKVLERTENRNKEDILDKFRKGVIQKFDGEKIQLLTNKEFKNEINPS